MIALEYFLTASILVILNIKKVKNRQKPKFAKYKYLSAIIVTCGNILENGSKVIKNQPIEKKTIFDTLYDLMKKKNIIKRTKSDIKKEMLSIEVSKLTTLSIVRLKGKNNIII